MSAGKRTAWWPVLRSRILAAVLFSLAAELALMGPTLQAAADNASTVGSSASSAGSADPVTAYVVNSRSGTVTPIATATNTVGPPITAGGDPDAIAITPDGKTAYVTNGNSDTVTPIVTATNTAGPPVTVGHAPLGIAITPDGKTAYVVNANSGTVTPIATSTNTAEPPITVEALRLAYRLQLRSPRTARPPTSRTALTRTR